MRPMYSKFVLGGVLLLIAPVQMLSQRRSEAQPQAPHYRVEDLGTFGGANSYYFTQPTTATVNNSGVVVGGAETSQHDPNDPNCFAEDCLTVHAFRQKHGALQDLGTLPMGSNSAALWISDTGFITGFADNGQIDPFTGTPDLVAVAWKNGNIVDVGTFGGSFSFPNGMNNRGEIVGVALDSTNDDFSMLGLGTETRAFLWRKGVLHDLGTLGGPDAWAAFINERGQIAGWSYTDYNPNETTGIPTQHPFLWENGHMRDLGTLGGTVAVVASLAAPGGGALNSRGQVVGSSYLKGDAAWHPFLWQNGRMIDLGTLGGANGEAYWINDSGDIVGRADVKNGTDHHAFLWRHGKMQDLGSSPDWPCSTAVEINARREVIIDTGICGQGGGPGMLWRNGVTYDLNTLVPPTTEFFIGDVNFINDRGEIAVTGVLPNGDIHDLLLVPCKGSNDEAPPSRIAAPYYRSSTAVASERRGSTNQGRNYPTH